MIARAESGQARDGMTEFDAAEIARGVGELYEPLADDKGIQLKVDAPAAAPVHGNRELVSQALANLVDNAILVVLDTETGADVTRVLLA
jgi:signal transduction histidine kinase